MSVYHYTFTHLGHAVTYRIMARNKHVANRFARQQERAWRLAIKLRLKELSPWS
jgi:hypothetical protein